MVLNATVGPLQKFNLLYHVAPFTAAPAWRANLRQLLLGTRLQQFNGRRVVAIATGPDMANPSEVKELLAGAGCEFITVLNNTLLRERASFLVLLDTIASPHSNEATFYAHAKGVASAGNAEAVMYWRNLMYHSLLDRPNFVREQLRHYPVVGSFRKRVSTVFRDRKVESPWHFSGTFFWFRHDAFFARPWQSLPESGWAVEACPGVLFKYEESYCTLKDNPGNPYDVRIYGADERIVDTAEDSALPGLLVEIGGGHKPYGAGYINVDRTDSADVRFDFETLAQEGARLPFADDSVASLYSSHCLEHVVALVPLMREIVRVCRIGATVEIRVPHYFSNMAMCHDHKQVIGHEQITHWTTSALTYWWAGGPKRLQLQNHTTIPGSGFARWRRLLPKATEQDILDLCPDGASENQWVFTVVPNI